MDRSGDLDAWARQDGEELAAALLRIPAGRVEETVRRALAVLDVARAADAGQGRVAPLGPPSTRTSAYQWTEDLRQDGRGTTFFETRVLQLRPDLLPDHDRFTGDPAWPALRCGVARVVRDWRSERDLLDRARTIDGSAQT